MAHGFSDFNASADDKGVLRLLRQLSAGVGYAASEASSEATTDMWCSDLVLLDEEVAALAPRASTTQSDDVYLRYWNPEQESLVTSDDC